MPLRPNFIERWIIRSGVIPGPLLDLGMGTFTASAMIAAGEIELFRTLDKSPLPLKELAMKTGTNERALNNLLEVLAPLGYVNKKNGQYELTNYTRKSVPVETFHEMIPFFKSQSEVNVLKTKEALQDAPEEGVFGWEKVKSGDVARSYQVTMRWLAGTTLDEVTKKMKMPKGGTKFLDIGGSHGLYCVEMCRKNPNVEATVFDWPIGIENARETLKQESDVSDRINTVEGDFHEDDFPGQYDLAFFGNIIHGNNPEENKKLLKKTAEATTDIGTIGILDQFDNISGSRFTRSVAALIGWNLFMFANGRAYEIDDVKRWLVDAGFPKITVKPLKKSPGFTLVVASKK